MSEQGWPAPRAEGAVTGTVTVPGSKSISNRALVLAAISDGPSHLTGLLGGLLLAAVDTEGKPGVAWRATHGAKAAKRETKRGAKAAKREAKQLARETKQAARLAKAELHLG